MIEEVVEVHDVIFLYTRESGHPAKYGRIICIQEEYPSVKIRYYWTSFAVEVSEGHHHEESINNESYGLFNVDTEGGIVRGCRSPFRKISKD